MSNAVMEEVRPLTQELEDEYDEYYEEDWDLYHSEKFRDGMREVFAEMEDMKIHPEKYKVYDSVKEMFRDMGFDVSNMPDD
ncbi:MAG: hypothetical protein IJQ24_02665 [Synergistaceae bacterium]|nr:hypothetical protein [Synergistaceae bacterium]